VALTVAAFAAVLAAGVGLDRWYARRSILD